ncbi:hypothetical protein JDV02_001946 [Purpureocillium takamizusanense]|uniref:Uncharacterized protein n=1 Tax=Purpureocillium takamizusanense TaxID=2060973 RepID=A0A9Q8V8C4_9HYPO|nr:uncharacterized protein JDV02_001946 [Purpureocillium takamizusanense]UNI15411.1 hypothetical protein JDV02_001946 [Purpureocillium takamizusanense]
MRSFAILLTLVTGAIAAVIPTNTTDGVYVVTEDEFGNEIHKRISNPIHSVSEARSLLAESEKQLYGRDDWLANENTPEYSKYCGCGFTLPTGDTDAAVADIKIQMGSGKWFKNKAVYAIRGITVAFVCNRSDDRQAWASSGHITKLLARVSKACGSYVPGTCHQNQGNDGTTTANIGYMRWYSGLDFCDKAQGSDQHGC